MTRARTLQMRRSVEAAMLGRVGVIWRLDGGGADERAVGFAGWMAEEAGASEKRKRSG